MIWSAAADRREVETVRVQPAPVGSRIRYPVGRYPKLVSPDGSVHEVRSILNERKPIRFGDYVWNDGGVPKGPAWIRVDLARQTMSVFRAGHEIGSAVILFGTDGKPTPSGVFPVLAKAETHRSSLYDAEMPFMLRLTGDGVAIHASNVRQGSATHGCVGIPEGFARLVFAEMRRGDEVVIMPESGNGAPGRS
ncbi:L,D-transpeptidase family protein [Sphingomonas sp. Leaf357]|uniref:L,D-transpeptidase family protein n=1 Tax=Sphingomonas sp. Leaf357 TaxID=1736350 RepID=UPI001EFF60D4|nr:L,D-transpeptidase family protein [Sphingomonas sp. Leaf357]